MASTARLKRDLLPVAGEETETTYFPQEVSVSNQVKAGPLRLASSGAPVLSANEILDYPGDRPRFRRILFIAPQPHGYAVPQAPTPSYGYLGELLGEQGFEWRVLDLRLGGDIEDVRAELERFRPDVLGYTFQFTIGADRCMRFLHEIAATTDLPILIGGAHLTLRGHNIMSDVPPVFAAVQKEGEYPLLALMKGVPLERIPNLWIRRDDRVVENPVLKYASELDALPWPKYPYYDMSRFAYRGQVDILTSRGCPYQCTFCSVALTQGRQFRRRSPENVVEEVRYWYDCGIRTFNFIDDVLTVNQKRFHRVLDLLLAEGFEGVSFSCTQGMRADACGVDLLEKMKRVGFEFLGFGVESGANRILELLKKGETIEELDEGISNACRLGFDVGLFFIIGSPTETVDEVEKSFEFALRHPVAFLQFHVCLPYPGTALADWVDDNSAWFVEPKEYLQNFSYYHGVVAFDNKGMTHDEVLEMLGKSMVINADVRRRHALRRMRSVGIPVVLAGPISFVLYNPYTFNTLRHFVRSHLGSRMRRYVVRLLNLDLKDRSGAKEISFTDGM